MKNNLDFLKPLPISNKARLGRNRDGGYVVYNRIIPETEVLFTYGVGWEISFEEAFNEVTGKKVLMFDPTMVGIYLLDWKAIRKHFFTLRFSQIYKQITRGLFLYNKKKELDKKDVNFVNEGISVTKKEKYDTFANHLRRFNQQDKKILLKLDIEGGEFEIFQNDDIYSLLGNVNQLLVEFHDLKNRLREVKAIMERIGENFELVHIHANNAGHTFLLFDLEDEQTDVVMPDLIEVTFVKKGLIAGADKINTQFTYPVPELDYPNDPTRREILLKFI
ncbi:FkbM family methyltransferase [Chitinophaga sp. LS1]|uniref:FkbM family methyltransferase n=1 Tax=Chitinophaga sp. LS1 TaxID=3051176 RepID=UPI002AAC037E|nr:FkbM family methyltransferase [Chitinophaga sp. LS1]WPV66538.1 FkbM family methyltransferase [Chitinophaga sp. LS1]